MTARENSRTSPIRGDQTHSDEWHDEPNPRRLSAAVEFAEAVRQLQEESERQALNPNNRGREIV